MDFGHYGGVQIVVSDAALTETTQRLFPFSKNRSARIHKKLVKRFGGVFRKKPAMFRVGDRIIAHPALYHELRDTLAKADKP